MHSPTHSDSDTSSVSDSTDGVPVESLVSGRVKRATAGKRLSALVNREQDDEIELLFAEGEEEADDSFDEDEGNASDVNLGSSSDEEDADGTMVHDDMTGEEELQRQAREEAKKRKAKAKSRVPGLAKKVKIDPTALRSSSRAEPRPKKKSERVSWVASEADAPTRISSRKQTVQNRETIHRRLVDGERQRKKVMQQMEEAQKRKEAKKPKAMTQLQRLEEAARIEKKNAKSLTRWEESENQRLREQKAKLEALHNRQISGPVLTWWSGLTRWSDRKIVTVGVKAIRDSGHLESPHKLMETSHLAMTSPSKQAPPLDIPSHDAEYAPTSVSLAGRGGQSPPAAPPVSQALPNILVDIHAYAALPGQNDTNVQTSSTLGPQPQMVDPQGPRTDGQVQPSHLETHAKDTEFRSRNLIALKNIDANAQKSPDRRLELLIRKHKPKLSRQCLRSCIW